MDSSLKHKENSWHGTRAGMMLCNQKAYGFSLQFFFGEELELAINAAISSCANAEWCKALQFAKSTSGMGSGKVNTSMAETCHLPTFGSDLAFCEGGKRTGQLHVLLKTFELLDI